MAGATGEVAMVVVVMAMVMVTKEVIATVIKVIRAKARKALVIKVKSARVIITLI